MYFREPEWSGDESIMALMNGGELFIYEIDKCEFGTSWDGKPTKKIGGGRNGRISISPSNTTTTLAFYVPGEFQISSAIRVVCFTMQKKKFAN